MTLVPPAPMSWLLDLLPRAGMQLHHLQLRVHIQGYHHRHLQTHLAALAPRIPLLLKPPLCSHPRILSIPPTTRPKHLHRDHPLTCPLGAQRTPRPPNWRVRLVRSLRSWMSQELRLRDRQVFTYLQHLARASYCIFMTMFSMTEASSLRYGGADGALYRYRSSRPLSQRFSQPWMIGKGRASGRNC